MPRAFVLVLDSVGIGGAPDAALYGDEGADTVGHIAETCAAGKANLDNRHGPLRLPHLATLGLGEACRLATGRAPPGLAAKGSPQAQYGCAREQSKGKDTPSGHWELAGVPVPFEWGYFLRQVPCFPAELVDELCRQAELPGILGNRHASGTEVIEQFGEEHMRSGAPIAYTSADSVLQIAAHEETFGRERLYRVCEIARPLADRYRIGRVIARPFIGPRRGEFVRTPHRRDYAVPPPCPTILDLATREGRDVITVGKVADIFAHSGTGRVLKAAGNDAMFDRLLEGAAALRDGGLLFANFVDFDTEFGHRRDAAGYAAALEAFDSRMPQLLSSLKEGDLAMVTADHGCDPCFSGTDHTREQVPILAFGPSIAPRCVGRRQTFADVGATAATHLALPLPGAGRCF